MSQETVEKIFDALEDISSEAEYIEKLAESFYIVGNVTLGEHLDRTTLNLRTQANNINHAHSSDIRERFDAAMESSGNMVGAIMAVKK